MGRFGEPSLPNERASIGRWTAGPSLTSPSRGVRASEGLKDSARGNRPPPGEAWDGSANRPVEPPRIPKIHGGSLRFACPPTTLPSVRTRDPSQIHRYTLVFRRGSLPSPCAGDRATLMRRPAAGPAIPVRAPPRARRGPRLCRPQAPPGRDGSPSRPG